MTPTSLVQLAQDWRGTLPAGGVMAEPKIDGWRGARFAGITGKTRLWTRQGHPIEGTAHILWRLDAIERAAGTRLMFDGEFQIDGSLAATKAWCERGWKLGGEAGTLFLFDAVPLDLWRKGFDPTPLHQRKARLRAWIQDAERDEWEWRPGSFGRDEGATPVVLLEDEWLFSAADVIHAAHRVWAAGGEGLMLKDPDAPYQRNRNTAWLKVKQENHTKWRNAA